MTPLETLIYECVRFTNWAAGEGLSPADGENAKAPDDILMDYSRTMDDPDWDKLPEHIVELIRKPE